MPSYFPSIPILFTNKIVTTNANNTTASFVCFTVTGMIRVLQLYGIVTTVLSSNHTAAHWRLNDQTATPAISLATGTTVSSAPVGSALIRSGLVATALTLNSSAAGVVQDPATAGNDVFSSFEIVQKTGATTTIDYRYSTTNAPSSGAIQFFLAWQPLSADASVS